MKKFSVSRKQEFFEIEKEDGTTEKLFLREMTALSRDQYMDSVKDRMRFTPDGKAAGLKRFEGLHSDLLHRTVFREDGTAVPIVELQSWPASVTADLYELSNKMNKLDALSEKEEKDRVSQEIDEAKKE